MCKELEIVSHRHLAGTLHRTAVPVCDMVFVAHQSNGEMSGGVRIIERKAEQTSLLRNFCTVER